MFWVIKLLVRQLVYTSLLLITTFRFTCGERNIRSTIKKSQNIMNMVVAFCINIKLFNRVKSTVMQIELALINDRLRVSNISWKISHSSNLQFCSNLPVKFSFPFIKLWMQKFQCLLFVLKRSYICYYIIFMTVPLIETAEYSENIFKISISYCCLLKIIQP